MDKSAHQKWIWSKKESKLINLPRNTLEEPTITLREVSRLVWGFLSASMEEQ